jgi:predicted HTH domain antitoxin
MEVSILRTVSIELPEDVVKLFGEKELEASLKKWTLLELVRTGKLSSGKAAEILGVTRWEFMELMSSHDVPIANFPEEELERQMKERI